jgi:uncharacterized lipoprotein YddW (UPF0748 family)
VKSYGKFLWLDPGEPDTQRETLDVMMDVVKRYDIDGVHIDDYFYPYKEKGPDGQEMDFPDTPSWAKYQAAGGKLGRADWRRKNVDDFIEKLYGSIKKEKPWVKFGISPFGIYRPGVPAGIQAGVDQYADLYADAKKWLNNGWCDYYSPQLYWPINQKPQSYPVLLDWWLSENKQGRHIWPGNFTSRTSPSEGNWSSQEVVNQVKVTRQKKADGNVHFSMKAFMQNYNGVASDLHRQVYQAKALVPASPWLDSVAPKSPNVGVQNEDGQVTISCTPDGDKDIRFYAIVPQIAGKWMPPIITSDRETVLTSKPEVPTRVAVFAIDRVGNQSPVNLVSLP